MAGPLLALLAAHAGAHDSRAEGRSRSFFPFFNIIAIITGTAACAPTTLPPNAVRDDMAADCPD
jgi:hypothetical protein